MLTYIVLILGIGILMFILLWKNPKKEIKRHNERLKAQNNAPKENLTKLEKRLLTEKDIRDTFDNEPRFYKSQKMRTFNIKGTYYQDITIQTTSKSFLGYIEAEENNDNDRYAVAIYDDTNSKLGYVPKGNKMLSDSLIEFHNGKCICWGEIWFDKYYDTWIGNITTPVAYNKDYIEKLNYIAELYTFNKSILSSEEINKSAFFKALDNHYVILEFAKNNKNIDYFSRYSFNKNTLISFGKRLEKEKDWESLIKLLEYKSLINSLAERYKNKLLSRIETAKHKTL